LGRTAPAHKKELLKVSELLQLRFLEEIESWERVLDTLEYMCFDQHALAETVLPAYAEKALHLLAPSSPFDTCYSATRFLLCRNRMPRTFAGMIKTHHVLLTKQCCRMLTEYMKKPPWSRSEEGID